MGLRERDIESVISGVLNIHPVYLTNSAGYISEIYCPICDEFTDELLGEIPDSITIRMTNIKHHSDCIWLIAKDLKHNKLKYNIDLV